MERLVCTYEFGWSCDIMSEMTNVTEPFTYESKQKAIDDFMANMIRIEDLDKEYKKKYKEWESRLNSISSTNIEKKHKVRLDEPEAPNYNFKLGYLTLNYHNLIDKNDYSKEKIIEPDFLTIDEWFKGK